MSEHGPPSVSRRWVNRIIWSLVALCVLVSVADLFYDKHGHYDFEHFPAFHSAYGFVSCVALVLTAKLLRRLLMRDEDYYDDE
ncbi:MAG TPA: hypothetical protein QGF58_07445 [Myxococcota bacterium]|nr:hypothetical protein [Myxococcota bacterium]